MTPSAPDWYSKPTYELPLAILFCLLCIFNQEDQPKKDCYSLNAVFCLSGTRIVGQSLCRSALPVFVVATERHAIGVITEMASVHECGPDIGPLANPL